MKSRYTSRGEELRSGISHRYLMIFWTTSLLLLLLIMGMIFCFSAANADNSSGMSQGLTKKLLSLFMTFFHGRMSEDRMLFWVEFWEKPIRKCAHFTEYMVLAFFMQLHFFFLAWRIKTEGRKRKRGRCSIFQQSVCGEKISWNIYRLTAILVCITYAISDEIHQFFVPGRACRFFDVCVDSGGVLCGSLFFLLIFACLLDGLIFKGYNQKR